MSSTSKGNAFEVRVYNILKAELASGELCISPKAAQIHHKKRYYSKDRKGYIVADISIEVSLPGKKDPSLIWIFECKDYTARIPIDDVEEFHEKLQQIGADNTKGTVVVTGALQRGALNYAESKKIGVIRILPDDQILHIKAVVSRKSLQDRLTAKNVKTALLKPDYQSRDQFFGLAGDYIYGEWFSFLEDQLRSHLRKSRHESD